MESLSRDKVLRWFSGQQSQGGSGGGGSDIDLGSYATKSWTDDNYVGKEFFSSLFKAYDVNGNEVLPNDTETEIDNIKAMFGFWTDFYISALGTGGQQSVDLRLAQLADVNVAGVTNGQVLTYDTTTGKWIASTPQSGTDMATVWSNLAATGNQQINYSHLSEAVSLSNGTITIGSSSITPITSHQSLAGYAKETWVGQNYLPLTGGTITGSLTVNNTLSTGGNATVGGDLTVNGGDLTVNEPNSSGASAIWFQSGGTTYGNLRVKASNGEFYFYNDIFEEMIHAIASSAPDATIILAGHAEGADTVYAIASRGNEDIDGYVFLSTSDFEKDDLPNMKNVFVAYGKEKSENYRTIFRKLFKTNILKWKYSRESTITEEKTNNAYIVGDWTSESTPLVLTEDFFWEWVFNIIPSTEENE